MGNHHLSIFKIPRSLNNRLNIFFLALQNTTKQRNQDMHAKKKHEHVSLLESK